MYLGQRRQVVSQRATTGDDDGGSEGGGGGGGSASGRSASGTASTARNECSNRARLEVMPAQPKTMLIGDLRVCGTTLPSSGALTRSARLSGTDTLPDRLFSDITGTAVALMSGGFALMSGAFRHAVSGRLRCPVNSLELLTEGWYSAYTVARRALHVRRSSAPQCVAQIAGAWAAFPPPDAHSWCVPPAPPSFNQIGCFGGVATDLGRPLPPSRTPVVPVLAVVPGTYPPPLASLERALCEGMWTHVRRLAVIFLCQPLSWICLGGREAGTGERRGRSTREVEEERGWRQGTGASLAAPRPHYRRTAGRHPRNLSRRIGPFGRRRDDHPLHDHPDLSPSERWVSGECPTAGLFCLNWPLTCTRRSALGSVSAPHSVLWCLPYVPVLFLSTSICSFCALPFFCSGGKRAGARGVRAARFTGSC